MRCLSACDAGREAVGCCNQLCADTKRPRTGKTARYCSSCASTSEIPFQKLSITGAIRAGSHVELEHLWEHKSLPPAPTYAWWHTTGSPPTVQAMLNVLHVLRSRPPGQDEALVAQAGAASELGYAPLGHLPARSRARHGSPAAIPASGDATLGAFTASYNRGVLPHCYSAIDGKEAHYAQGGKAPHGAAGCSVGPALGRRLSCRSGAGPAVAAAQDQHRLAPRRSGQPDARGQVAHGQRQRLAEQPGRLLPGPGPGPARG